MSGAPPHTPPAKPKPGLAEGMFGSQAQYDAYAQQTPQVGLYPKRWLDKNDVVSESPLVSQLRGHCSDVLTHPTEFPLVDAPYDKAPMVTDAQAEMVNQDLLFFLSPPNAIGSLGFSPVFAHHVISRLGVCSVDEFFEFINDLPALNKPEDVAQELVDTFEPQLSMAYTPAVAKIGFLKQYVADISVKQQGNPFDWKKFSLQHFMKTNRKRLKVMIEHIQLCAEANADKMIAQMRSHASDAARNRAKLQTPRARMECLINGIPIPESPGETIIFAQDLYVDPDSKPTIAKSAPKSGLTGSTALPTAQSLFNTPGHKASQAASLKMPRVHFHSPGTDPAEAGGGPKPATGTRNGNCRVQGQCSPIAIPSPWTTTKDADSHRLRSRVLRSTSRQEPSD